MTKAKADLHVHSDISHEGGPEAKKIIDKALEIGLKAIAITDHDAIPNLEDLVEYRKEKDIEIIPAIEISARLPINKKDMHVHILGYHIDSQNVNLLSSTKKIKEAKKIQCKEIIEKMNEKYPQYDINFNEILEKYGGISRMLVAMEMEKKGYIKDYHDAFKGYFGLDNMPCYVPMKHELHIQEAIQLINDARGIPILAHPPTLKNAYKKMFKTNDPGYDEVLPLLIDYGIRGLEMANAGTERELKNYDFLELWAFIEDYGLLVTGGSDAHELDEIGREVIPYRYVAALNKEKKRIDSTKYKLEKN